MDGILIVNKPYGCTSHDVVNKVKKVFNQKVGHTGTLDPMATGVLPLLIGKGTLISKYLINHDKIYEATIKLGIRTDTLDSEGKIIEEKEVQDELFEKEFVQKVLKSFLGEQKQIPPMYSAIKVNGKKLYDYARNGENVEIPERNIKIYDICLLNIDSKNAEIKFRVECSKGTYIRTLCENIAKKIGNIGYMSALNRVKVGDFKIEDAISIDEIGKSTANIIEIEDVFQNNEKIILNDIELQKLLNGVKIKKNLSNGVYRIYNYCDKFVGLGTINDMSLKRDVIL